MQLAMHVPSSVDVVDGMPTGRVSRSNHLSGPGSGNDRKAVAFGSGGVVNCELSTGPLQRPQSGCFRDRGRSKKIAICKSGAQQGK